MNTATLTRPIDKRQLFAEYAKAWGLPYDPNKRVTITAEHVRAGLQQQRLSLWREILETLDVAERIHLQQVKPSTFVEWRKALFARSLELDLKLEKGEIELSEYYRQKDFMLNENSRDFASTREESLTELNQITERRIYYGQLEQTLKTVLAQRKVGTNRDNSR